jgi:hypothetical protein
MPRIEDVLGDIIGLTKINYNACNFNDGLPVTVRFADKAGDVLSLGMAKGAEKQPFKFSHKRPSDVQPLAKQRFEAFAGYSRHPKLILISKNSNGTPRLTSG